MGGLHGGFCSFSVALRWRCFPKNAPQKWAIYTAPVLYPLRCLFFFGAAYMGIPFFFRCAVCFFKFAFGAVYTGTPVFFLNSATCSFFLGGGVRFFSAFNAVLFCTFVVGRVVRACLGLPSVGFVNAV